MKYSTLKDKTQNRYGAKAMETHHHVIEWALANAIDPAKFNRSILPHLKLRHRAILHTRRKHSPPRDAGLGRP